MTIPKDSGPELAQIQRWMQAVIMHPVGIAEGLASIEVRQHLDVRLEDAETVITRSAALTAQRRLANMATPTTPDFWNACAKSSPSSCMPWVRKPLMPLRWGICNGIHPGVTRSFN